MASRQDGRTGDEGLARGGRLGNGVASRGRETKGERGWAMNCSREGAGSWGPSCRKAIQAEAKRAGHFRRFKVYDYSRGAAIFITFGVVGRPQVFGQINAQGELEHSPAGQAAVKALLTEAAKGTGIRLMQFVVMPDHVHLRLYIEPGLEKPLARLANFVRNFKRWSKWLCSKEGVAFDWEPGYHDRLCLSREIIELADKYIRNNPLKWHLLHGDPPPLKVVEPLASGRIATTSGGARSGRRSFWAKTSRSVRCGFRGGFRSGASRRSSRGSSRRSTRGLSSPARSFRLANGRLRGRLSGEVRR